MYFTDISDPYIVLLTVNKTHSYMFWHLTKQLMKHNRMWKLKIFHTHSIPDISFPKPQVLWQPWGLNPWQKPPMNGSEYEDGDKKIHTNTHSLGKIQIWYLLSLKFSLSLTMWTLGLDTFEIWNFMTFKMCLFVFEVRGTKYKFFPSHTPVYSYGVLSPMSSVLPDKGDRIFLSWKW